MKKILFTVLALVLCFCMVISGSCTACADMREYIDDCGRTVSIPGEIKRIAVSGPLTQIYILPLCPEMMVGYSNEFSKSSERFIKQEYLSLPTLGQLYGGKSTMNLEALLEANPDIIIDVGEQKGSMAEDLDGLTEQTGIPSVHVDATVTTAPEAYRKLGDLTGKAEKAEELAEFLEKTLADVNGIMEKVDADGARKTVLYCLGDKGLNVLAEKSFHAETINMVANNAAEIENVISSGDGNESDFEQFMIWNPDVIIFAPDSIYAQVGEDPVWNQLSAIENGDYYETPAGPYGWLQSPPSVQRYLGMIWLPSVLYPEYCDYDLESEITQYYKLFYDYDMTHETYSELTVNAVK